MKLYINRDEKSIPIINHLNNINQNNKYLRDTNFTFFHDRVSVYNDSGNRRAMLYLQSSNIISKFVDFDETGQLGYTVYYLLKKCFYKSSVVYRIFLTDRVELICLDDKGKEDFKYTFSLNNPQMPPSIEEKEGAIRKHIEEVNEENKLFRNCEITYSHDSIYVHNHIKNHAILRLKSSNIITNDLDISENGQMGCLFYYVLEGVVYKIFSTAKVEVTFINETGGKVFAIAFNVRNKEVSSKKI